MSLLSAWLLPALLSVSAGSATEPADTTPPSPAALDPAKPLTAFTVDLWTEEDGLAQNMASAIAQTQDGYLWFGTEEGLVRFDGVRFRTFDPASTPAFSTAWVTALWPDADGALWIGTGGGGLIRMHDGRFRAFTGDDGLTHTHISAIFRGRDGTLWVGTNGGGLHRRVDGRFEPLDSAAGPASDFITAIDQDSAGALWVGTGAGLHRIGPEGGIRVYRRGDGLASDRVRDVLVDRRGDVWAATSDGGVSRLRDGRFTTFSAADGLSGDYATSLYEDAAGAIWVGTNGMGINRIHDGRIRSLGAGDGLPGSLVLSVAGDREGGLWLGLTGVGLARLRDGMFRTLGRPEELSTDIALALLEGRDGTVWIGTAGGGLNVLRDDRITTLTVEDGLAHNVILALAETREGDLWVSGAGGGISRIRDGRIRTFGPADGLLGTRASDIVDAGDGSLWLAVPGAGVQRWRPDGGGTGRVLTREDGLPDAYVTALHRHSDGTLWIGTRRGLGRLEDGRVVTVPVGAPDGPGNNITGLYEEDDGDLWASTNRGIARITADGAALYGGDTGPFAREFHGIIRDTLGYLWATSNGGIIRVRERDLVAASPDRLDGVGVDEYSQPDGLRSAEFNGGINPATLRLRASGELWFPTMRGVAIADPARLSPPRPLPEPIIEMLVTGDGPQGSAGPIQIPAHRRSLEIRFTAPTAVAPDELRFRYRLEGFDADWVDAGGRRVAWYTNVPPGPHRFRVAVRRGSGPWRETAAPLELHLAPHFYETPAFLALAAALLLGLGLLGYRLRIRGLTRRQRELIRAVADRDRSQEALRVSEERLRLALEAGRLGTWEWDADTDGFTASGASEQILPDHPETGQAALAQMMGRVAHADLQRIADVARGLEDGRDEFDLHFPLRFGDRTRHVEVRGRAFFRPDGTVSRVAGVVADVSDFMETQATLRRREEELRQSQKMEAIGRLAGGVAHDFNNLLTAISGRTELVLEALPGDDEMREDVEEVRDAARRASSLTQQLLTFSRKHVFRPRTIDLNQVVHGVDRMLRRLVREDVVLDTRLDPDLGAVSADPVGMEQVLLNLVVNAQDAMPNGGRVVIETRNAPGEGGAGHAVLVVRDTGHGMDEETRAQAFEPFFTTKPTGKGTGLGLSTVYGIVRQSDGEILLESRVGIGTSFEIRLPLVTGTADADVPGNGSAPDDRGSETILLVEDELAVRTLTRKILQRRGYRVLDADSGPAALDLWHSAGENGAIDMLISDVVMPHMSGRELAERIRTLQPDIPVLLMSGYNEDEVLRQGVPGSGMAFLQKPFQAAEFVARVRQVLDGHPVAHDPVGAP